MSLFLKLQQRAEAGQPIRVGLIGAGKFGSMFLAQAQWVPGIHVVGVADLQVDNARSNLAYVGWRPEKYGARNLDEAAKCGATRG